MIRGLWVRAVLIVATVLLALPCTIVSLVVPRWSNVITYCGRLWSRVLLAASGASVTLHGRENARAVSPCIFIANHQSIVDIWVMFRIIPPAARFAAKEELFRIPVFGWALASSGTVPINRRNRTEAIRSLRAAAERIRAGRPVVLFPEGTRSPDGRLQPFKKGAFHLALQAGVPVVPVAITGSFSVLAPGRLRVTPGPVEVFVEPPVDVTPYLPDDHEGLLRRVQETIGRRFDPPAAGPQGRTLELETP
jgi:1-acyl-sn-glycerol-3-phosphate acyltransferase